MSRRGRRFASLVAGLSVVAVILAASAWALRFSDESYLTPTGVVGQPYTHRFTGPPPDQEGRGCDPPYTFKIDSGALPPGLALSSDGLISGVPTQAGNYSFYVSMRDDPTGKESWCNPASAEREFTIKVVPGLVVGPESAGPGTVGVAYSLALTATLSDPKTWSIDAGALPPGLALGASSGVISGTPTTPGVYTFTVRAFVDAQRTDTKTLTIAVRPPVAAAALAPFDPRAHVARSEVGVAFRAPLTATGGSGSYTWSLAAGELPAGVALAPNGLVAGRPTLPGTYRFTASVADTEGRIAAYEGALLIAPRLSIATRALRPGAVGRAYRATVVVTGGARPTTWRVAAGRLPRGVRLDPARGILSGAARSPGRYRVTFEVVDSLGVTSTRTLVLIVRA